MIRKSLRKSTGGDEMEGNIAPTKANLLNAQATLEFSKNGYELLDKKRNVLIREMMGLIDRAREVQNRIHESFAKAYEALMMANLTMGLATVASIAENIQEDSDFELLYKSVMGVEIPVIKYFDSPAEPAYSFYETNAAMDTAFKSFREVKYAILELAEIETSVYRLAKEIKKTQKRANALENIQIPKYTAIVKMISEVLEEKEREDFFRLKVMKKKEEQKRQQGK